MIFISLSYANPVCSPTIRHLNFAVLYITKSMRSVITEKDTGKRKYCRIKLFAYWFGKGVVKKKCVLLELCTKYVYKQYMLNLLLRIRLSWQVQ